MSVLGDIIGREWLECELDDAKRELERVTDRAHSMIREEIRRRCSVNLKTFPGTDRDVTVEEVAREVYEVVTGQRESVDVTNEPL